MNRRDFMRNGTIALSTMHVGELGISAQAQAEGKGGLSWLSERPLIIVGNWDDMPIFRKRVGGGPEWLEEDYRKEHTEEAVRKLQDLGATLAVIHFFKGFGLRAEQPQIEDAKRLAALCHRYDIKVGVYVGSTIASETFLLEMPEAEEWFVPDFLGKPVTYGGQTFRKRVYFMHPGYREYIKRVLTIALEEVKADLIHFDNTSMQAQPAIFHHPLAIQDFRKYLTSIYTPQALEKRFGFNDPKYVLPPRVEGPLTVIDDPLFQDWTEFRCRTLSRYYEEMAGFVHSLNPAVAVESNPSTGLAGSNTYWSEGVDYPRLLASTQIACTEEGDAPAVTPQGILVSKIRTYKMAALLGNKIFTYTGVAYGGPTPNESQMKLEVAESMTYNRQCLGMIGSILSAQDLPESAKKYVRFFTENFRFYRDVESAPDVAVLHSFPTLAFNSVRPYESTWLFEQALIQAKVPFELIFDIENISRYSVLVLADQECLSDGEMVRIREGVAQGLGLVATELTSLYTPDRRVRRDFGLSDLFKIPAPIMREWKPIPELPRLERPVRNVVGKGRVAYLPEVKPAISRPPDKPMTSQYWMLPVNWAEMIDAVKWAAGRPLSLEVQGPLTVTAELLRAPQAGGWVLHLINYDVARHPTVKDIHIRVDAQEIGKVREISLHSPDLNDVRSLPFTVSEGQVRFSVPMLETYSLVTIVQG
jgi:hypothetical protein